MKSDRDTQPLLPIATTPAEKNDVQRLADLNGITPEEMAARLIKEAAARRLRGEKRFAGDVWRFPPR